MQIDSLDHLVLTIKNIDATISFYSEVLGIDLPIFLARKMGSTDYIPGCKIADQ